MARIAGVDLPREKRIGIGLTYIYGIGHVRSAEILAKAGIEPTIRVKELTEEQVSHISKTIDSEGGVEGDLRKEISMNIKRLMDIGAYSRTPPSSRPSRTRTAHEHECADAQRAEAWPNEEEVRLGMAKKKKDDKKGKRKTFKKKEKRTNLEWDRPHPSHFQQHPRHCLRHGRQRGGLGQRGRTRLQGISEGNALRGSAGREPGCSSDPLHGM